MLLLWSLFMECATLTHILPYSVAIENFTLFGEEQPIGTVKVILWTPFLFLFLLLIRFFFYLSGAKEG